MRYMILLLLFLAGCGAVQEITCGEYAVGESFPASDGCNTCYCGEDGSIACTEMACAPVAVGDIPEPLEEDTYTSSNVAICCEERHKSDMRIQCVGSWEYISSEDQCVWKCETTLEPASDCSTLTEANKDACCEEQAKGTFRIQCLGEWLIEDNKCKWECIEG